MLPGTDFTHWLGIRMGPHMALSYKYFIAENKNLMNGWIKNYPQLEQMPPIYWEHQSKTWVWLEIRAKDIKEYFALCERIILYKIENSNA